MDAGALLISELDGLRAGMEEQADQVIEICRKNGAGSARLSPEQERADLWKCRKQAFGAIGRLSPGYLTQDGVVPLAPRDHAIHSFRQRRSISCRLPNVFHAGDENIHPLILFDDRKPDEVERAVKAGEDILEKCVEMGGSVTGEHGIGIEKVEFMSRQFSAETLDVMKSLQDVFDPEHRCNPHKMFPGGKRCSEFIGKKQIAA